MPLEQLGPYKLERTLGRGGMGAVYAGVNQHTGERAAVKVLSAHLVDDPGFRERFKIEIETLKRLLHPNIVQLFGYGEEEGHLFYAMELVSGRSLQDELVAGRRFAWREVARIGIAVAQALKHAHDRGIVHRDLKPANLLLDEQEHVKLADFGIAKLYGGNNVTADGGVLGTADYMAPEQADGKQITTRCDLYSLGSVLYALLAGRPPFTGRSIVEVISALKSEKPVPVGRLAPDVPEELESIVGQLLEKDPQKRIPTALALMNRLKAMEHALSPETRVLRSDELNEPDDGLDPLPVAPPGPSGSQSADAVSSAVTGPLAEGVERRPAGEMPTLITAGGSVLPAHTHAIAGATDVSGAGGGFAGAARPRVATPIGAAAREVAPPRTSNFTAISEAELRHAGAAESADDANVRQWLAIAGLMLLAIVGIGAAIFFTTRQPSGDQLYARIEAAAAGGVEQLAAVEPDLTRFLAEFSHDPRAAEVQEHREDLELYRLERRFELRARRLGGAEELSPIERAYLEAVQLQTADPAAALAHFEALVAVFGGPPELAAPAAERRTTEQCLGLARKQIQRLLEVAASLEREQRLAIREQLERATKQAATDRPAANRIRQGVITLYEGKAWAADLVEQARAALQTPE